MFSLASQREPWLACRLADSGSYRLLIHERAYRKDDFSCYRLVIATGPQVALAMPHVLSRFDQGRLTLLGHQLPGGKPVYGNAERHGSDLAATLEGLPVAVCDLERSPLASVCFLSPAALLLDGSRFRHKRLGGDVRLGLSSEPVVMETEDHPAGPQPIELPCRVAGRFQLPGDVDRFRFTAQKNEVLRIESFGERLDQLMDLEISIHDDAGKQLSVLGDLAAPKGVPAKLPLASLDAGDAWKVPADGAYELVLRDLYGGSVYGPDRIYELVVARQVPGFHVVAMHSEEQPSRGLSVLRGSSAELQLIAVRRGGFAGPILVRAEHAPPGVSVEACTIASKEVAKSIKITANRDSLVGMGPLRLVAEAEIGSDKQVVPVLSAGIIRNGVTRNMDDTVIRVADE